MEVDRHSGRMRLHNNQFPLTRENGILVQRKPTIDNVSPVALKADTLCLRISARTTTTAKYSLSNRYTCAQTAHVLLILKIDIYEDLNSSLNFCLFSNKSLNFSKTFFSISSLSFRKCSSQFYFFHSI